MDKLEALAALGRQEETFRQVNMMQLLLQSAGTMWPQLQQEVLTFLKAMLDKLSRLR